MAGYTNTFALGSTNSWAPSVSGQPRWWHVRPTVQGWQGRSLTGGFVQPNQLFVPVSTVQGPGTVGAARQRYGNENAINQSGHFVAGDHRRVYRSRGLNT